MQIQPFGRSVFAAGWVLVSCGSWATTPLMAPDAYLMDGSGRAVTAADGSCWRTLDGIRQGAVAHCNPAGSASAPVPPPLQAKPVPDPQPLAPVAPATPAPIAVSAAPDVVSVLPVSMAVDVLFGFDQAELLPEGRRILDRFLQQMSSIQLERVVVTGHADRLGRTSYNQNISERRAQAVLEYLLEKQMPADKVVAVGRGESMPVTKPGQCAGPKSARVIACLQPDRRVEIDLMGARRIQP